ncbi:MAG: UPF0158 family protein [Desulfuromonadaceae bacterium]|nr:UPF0158 family protein [Desulfuromonadaceae bacterium]
MGFVHNVEISWDELLNAFTNGLGDHVYFLDKMTGEIFFVSAKLEDDDFWRQIETNQERFLEIPHFDLRVERQIVSDFICTIKDSDLKNLLTDFQSTIKPYGNLDDILEFFPEDQDKFLELKNDFLSKRMKHWLEEHNLFTVDAASLPIPSP